jgi:adenine/guanine phosphoribosyltransferase-like PRPP-binding protein
VKINETLSISAPYHYRELFWPKKMKVMVERCARALERLQKTVHFDGLACCGISGMLPAGSISYITGLPLTVLRKSGEDKCHGYQLTGLEEGRLLFLDDVVDSGSTLRHVDMSIRDHARCMFAGFHVVGAFLYNQRSCDASEACVPVYTLEDVEAGKFDRPAHSFRNPLLTKEFRIGL